MPRRAEEAPLPLVQRLPWDFKTTFPQPLEEAIDKGMLDESDRGPENLRELHECHARQCLGALKTLDVVMDARRRSIDPATGKPPRTHAVRERLRQYVADEPAKLKQAFRVIIETYENAFGTEAADAFQKSVRAWHAGIEVVAESSRSATPRPAPTSPARARPASPRVARLRPSSALPVPRPLPAAIAAGRFGAEDGKPLRPSPDEVRAITQQHADKLIDLPHQRQDTNCGRRHVRRGLRRGSGGAVGALRQTPPRGARKVGQRTSLTCQRNVRETVQNPAESCKIWESCEAQK